MTDEERDKLIIEMHTDIKWLKGWTVDHKSSHSKYIYYFITTAIACILAWFK